MDRERFYQRMAGEGTFDYEKYLRTPELFACQTDYAQLNNRDELQFQIVHQVEELWLKLVAYTLLEVDDHLVVGESWRVLTLLQRVHDIQRFMISHLDLLATMSPKDYQAIRLGLGGGSGQGSPGFGAVLQMHRPLWRSFRTGYLDRRGLTVEQIYSTEYTHDDAYLVAEALFAFDVLFQRFRYHHLQLIHRTIGLNAHSLKGRSVETLEDGLEQRFFPELWHIRTAMTDDWGQQYGRVREPLGDAGV